MREGEREREREREEKEREREREKEEKERESVSEEITCKIHRPIRILIKDLCDLNLMFLS